MLYEVITLPMVKSVTLTFITDLSKSKKIHYNKFGETRNQVLNYGYSYNQIAMHNTQILHEKGYTGKGMTIARITSYNVCYTKLLRPNIKIK